MLFVPVFFFVFCDKLRASIEVNIVNKRTFCESQEWTVSHVCLEMDGADKRAFVCLYDKLYNLKDNG